ncbi:Flp pilus assembly protein CpaB [Xinfangfangia pollutisoli]|uniref:Flp pilus assembly protein CpaB n=1 Tax=Xinfangfangia pollutisoli TaxID=2865960 RepID=UPI001CD6C673|nr:Flp pilus assembly protein CpaB [Xinfangfangia pollutisoli]
MRAVFALVLVAGLALAGFAVHLAQNYMGQTQAELARATAFQKQTGRLVPVYAVAKALKFGDPLTKDNVIAVYVQEKFLPPGAFLVPPKEGEAAPAPAPAVGGKAPAAVPVLFPKDTDKPRYVMRSMEPNEILLASRLTAPGEVAGLTGKLEKGLTAFQIKVDTASGVSGLVVPDNYIDIYWTGASAGNVNGEVTRLIESAIRVIAVDQASSEGQMTSGTAARTVTVAATREQVARLAQAQATGRLAMSLVVGGDDVALGLVEVDSNSLLGIEQKEVVAVEAPQVCTIKTRKGADVVEIPIPCTN